MNNLRNSVRLIGWLGITPQLRGFDNGKKMARFSLATSETYRGKNGEKTKETQWHNIVAWGNLADIAAKYLKKGGEIAIEGKLVNRTYNDDQGNVRYHTEVVVKNLLMLKQGSAQEA